MSLRRLAGFPTHVTRLAEGARQVLAIHCSLAHSGAWGPLAQALQGCGIGLTGFDLPGHGRSAPWTGAPEPHGLATAIAAELAAEAGPVDLLGHSFGATVALRLALERPGLVRSLAMIEPVLFAAAGPGARAAQRRHEATMDTAFAAGDAERAARAFLGVWGAGTPWEALTEAQRRAMAAQMPMIPALAPVLWDDAAGLLSPGRAEALAAPALLLAGDRSPAVIAAICDGLEARIPGLRRIALAGAGHMAPMTHADAVAQALRTFWAAV